MTHHHSKMFRGKDRWVIHTAMQGRDVELTRLEGVQHDMVLGRSGTAAAEAEGAKDPKGANAPLSQAMERGGMALRPTLRLRLPLDMLAPTLVLTSAREQSGRKPRIWWVLLLAISKILKVLH